MMDLQESIHQRRSIRHYLSRPVERSKIEKLLSAAQKAPVSCNLQVTQFLVIDNPEILKKLGKEVSYKFLYAPVAIVALYDSRFTVERSSVVTALGMAVENMLLVAVEEGLGTCAMAGFQRDDVIKEVLGIPSELTIGLLISVGYPDVDVYHSSITKLPLEKTFAFNTYDNLPLLRPSLHLRDHSPASIKDYRSRIGCVYLDRFRLNTWSDRMYSRAADFFLTRCKPTEDNRILDLMTYDAKFLHSLQAAKFSLESTTASDYTAEHLAVYKSLLHCQTTLIDESNKVQNTDDNSFDFITCVYQSCFTPEFDQLLIGARQLLKTTGALVLIHGQEVWWKRLRRSYRQLIARLQGKKINIYENNPYFKIGPYQHRTVGSMKRMIRRLGLEIEETTYYRDNGIMTACFLARFPHDEASTKI